MEEWKELLDRTIADPEKLAKIAGVDSGQLKNIHQEFPLRVNPYYLSLIREKDDAVWK